MMAVHLPVKASDEQIEILVEGQGHFLNEARLDAMTRAVQQAVDQLIVVDRLVEDGELMRDRILTTFNGFVTGFRLVRSSSAQDGSIDIQALISVSTSGMRNFLAYGDRSRSGLDGESMFAELARSREHAGVVDSMLQRALAGYPSHAYSTTLRSVGLDHRNRIRLEIGIDGEQAFFSALRDALRLLSQRFIGFQPTSLYRFPAHRHLHMHLTGQTLCLANAPMFNPDHQVVVHCGLLPPGEYFGWLNQRARLGGEAALVFALLDGDGRSMVPTNSGCWLQRHPAGFGSRFPLGIVNDSEGRHLVLAPIRSGMELFLPADGIDLAGVRHFVGMIVLVQGDQAGLVADLTGELLNERQVCDYLLRNHSPLMTSGSS